MKKTTMYLEEGDLAQLCEELGLSSEAEAVRTAIGMALQTLAYRRIESYAGTEKGRPAVNVPRRREPAATTKARARTKKSA